jgi:DNA-binding MarR family transcriptional regulator
VEPFSSRPPRAGAAAGPARTVQITDTDRALLAFAAEHRFVIAAQIAVLLGVSQRTAGERLRRLSEAGYLRRRQELHRGPRWHQITRAGLRAIDSDLPAPRGFDLATHRHDTGLAWLMLTARAGRFGPLVGVISERRMRSHDGRATDRSQRYGVRLGGVGPGGRDRLHYPDMVIVSQTGHRVAFELELSTKEAGRRERILAGYAADRRIDAVVYLVEHPSVGRAIERSARRMGISDLVQVQRVSMASGARAEGPARARAAGRQRAPHVTERERGR